jgi:hypothetical protein
MQCVFSRMLRSNHFSFYFRILTLKFVEIPAATHGYHLVKKVCSPISLIAHKAHGHIGISTLTTIYTHAKFDSGL